MKKHIKKFLKDNKTTIVYYTAGAIVGIVAYTVACDARGFKMVAPMYNEEGELFFQGIRGNVFTTELIKK